MMRLHVAASMGGFALIAMSAPLLGAVGASVARGSAVGLRRPLHAARVSTVAMSAPLSTVGAVGARYAAARSTRAFHATRVSMKLRTGIVGLPNVGKSTLFNALTETQGAEAANYPFCTIEPNVGMVEVPDPRLKVLGDMHSSARVVPTTLEFVDIAGLVKGASEGEGLGNQFLANIRECDAVTHVVRCFEDPNVVHVVGARAQPARVAAARAQAARAQADAPEAPRSRASRAAQRARSAPSRARARRPRLRGRGPLTRAPCSRPPPPPLLLPSQRSQDGSVDPVRDAEVINLELALSDLAQVEKRLERVAKDRKADPAEAEVLRRAQASLEQGEPARNLLETLSPEDAVWLERLQLLTAKKMIYAANVADADLAEGNDFTRRLEELAQKEGASVVVVSAQVESELIELSDEERAEFLESLGVSIEECGLRRLIRAAYGLLGLRTFFTSGETETRAWTIRTGWTAPQAAGVIHGDFEKNFIRAETIGYDDLVQSGSEKAAKEAGLMRAEGKEYVVREADVMLFRHGA